MDFMLLWPIYHVSIQLFFDAGLNNFFVFSMQTIAMLKQTCTMLEGQVEELEVMNDEYQDREDQWNILKLVDDLKWRSCFVLVTSLAFRLWTSDLTNCDQ